ncbi:transmembrane protein 201 [Brienomyrus brachyistius]|uniref:transmembrane protein 201 n=1 Tax=Brienomyrus brachyistius TaxID=42636 RepID=UPI0020B3DCB8|nr:transmembrane protein 201 [Brienomyrus brachyistius]
MDAFNQMLSHYPHALYGGAGATACATGVLIYRIVTRKKPTHVNVNCWFCNQDTVVPYGNRNCWDCPNCEQYNGFQENGDYNKPIPAQYMEHLNHGVSAGLTQAEVARPLQWVNCQMLLCKKCNHNQTLKIKQLASFLPRDEEKYDEEIEVYRHHLEQTYKLCRPCQTAVEYYIKHQNRQLRALLFSHQLRRGRDAQLGCVQASHSISPPAWVILLRFLAFLTCVFLVLIALYGRRPFLATASPLQTQSGGVNSPGSSPPRENVSDHSGSELGGVWRELLGLVPGDALEKAQVAWDYGNDHQMVLVFLGLLTCVSSIFLAGLIRLRRIDAMASLLWFLVLSLYLLESYLQPDTPGWLDTVKLSTTALCCLVGFAAAVATRKAASQRRARARRYLSGSSLGSYYDGHIPVMASALSGPSPSFAPTPPPNLLHFLSRQLCQQRGRRASPSSLPGRLSRALSLGTIPSLACTDSGQLFSGSRQPSLCKDSLASDYFSLKSGSRPSSPGPSPAPSVAGSVTSTSSSARHRRPIISPARLHLGGKKLRLFSSPTEPGSLSTSRCSPEPGLYPSSIFGPESLAFPSSNRDLGSLLEDSSVYEDVEEKKKSGSSNSSTCLVDTTTGRGVESRSALKGILRCSLWLGLLGVSLTANLVFASLYCYHTWR